ncbi:hypothetical protein [Pseudomonas sp. TNT3]|uniref:hypothetical protein n=1 Tax=Pseudomonas sp. TNT3 TaxID=2654097 RepID=UPI001FF17236|nr:hypothetical protein [Pseudomonas sp. TNT3]KAI2684100.1 hypothetical protein GBC55_015075 [Pseudomonas sp. TNT3]
MIDVDEEIIKIRKFNFFSNLGVSETKDSTLIYIGSVREAFVEPSVQAFEGLYNDVKWLPSSQCQPDPFYNLPKPSSDLVAMRMKINKAVLAATNNFDKSKFRCAPHDFSVAARNGVCFTFRQYVSEQYYGLGDHWARIAALYGKGHWPIGFCENKFFVI